MKFEELIDLEDNDGEDVVIANDGGYIYTK